MVNLNLLLYLSITVPFGMLLLICRGSARRLSAFFLLGTTAALFCGELNGILVRILPFEINYYSANLAPITEEICKAIPVVFYALAVMPDRQKLMEVSAATGIGFAVLESAYVFASSAVPVQLTTALLRAFGAGMMHGVCTLAVGFGMSFVSRIRSVYFAGTLALLSVAFVFHSTYNSLVLSGYTGIAFLLPSVTLLTAFLLFRYKKKQEKETDSEPKPEPQETA